MEVAFQRDTTTAVDNRADEIRADHLLVELFAAAADIGVKVFLGIAAIRSKFFDGFTVKFMPFLFPLPSLLHFGTWRHTGSG